MRILHYNILEGCRGDEARLSGVLAWVAAQNADVAGLSELNGWDDPPRMPAHAATCGFAHSHLLVGTSRYRIGLMARQPIVVLREIVAGVHHGILHLRVGDVHYLYTHFSPHDRLMRVHEAQLCAQIAASVSEPLVLMGDLNSHSALDEAMCRAFLAPENAAWAVDFAPQQILLDAGLRDTAATAPDRWTLPTAMHPNGLRRRVDYIYVNADFDERYPGGQARIIHGPEVDNLSDHYPVICDIPAR